MHSSPRTPNTSCFACGKPYYTVPSLLQSGRSKYCSRDCRWAGKRQVEKTCGWCGTSYRTWRSKAEISRTCSRLCQNRLLGAERSKPKTVTRSCTECSKPFVTRPASNGNKTCSKACANEIRRRASGPLANKDKRLCTICGAAFFAFPSRPDKYCSPSCGKVGNLQARTGKRRNALTSSCAFCCKEVTKPRCRIERSEQVFCGNKCYHAWDKAHKNTTKQKALNRARAVQMIASGVFASPSKIEGVVAAWLTAHDLAFVPQVAVAGYFTVDFQVGSVFVEVNGCYWHACPCKRKKPLTESQKKRIGSDKARATYCRNRGITLLTIWEHDIRRGNFTALAPLLPSRRIGLCNTGLTLP